MGLAAGASAQSSLSTVSSASYSSIVAPGAIASSFGTNLATETVANTVLPLPTTLGNTQVSIMDSAKVSMSAQLIFVSPTQVNFIVPAMGLALGNGTVTITSGTTSTSGSILISNVSPAIYTANASGTGVAAAQVLSVDGSGAQTLTLAYQGESGNYTGAPITLGSNSVYLVLFGTGISRHSSNPVLAKVKGTSVPVAFAGSQNQFPGLDQVNIGPIPASLAGAGEVDVVVTVDGIPANATQVVIQ